MRQRCGGAPPDGSSTHGAQHVQRSKDWDFCFARGRILTITNKPALDRASLWKDCRTRFASHHQKIALRGRRKKLQRDSERLQFKLAGNARTAERSGAEGRKEGTCSLLHQKDETRRDYPGDRNGLFYSLVLVNTNQGLAHHLQKLVRVLRNSST